MAVVFLPYGGGLGNLVFYHHAAFAVSKKLGAPMYINSDYQDEKRKNIALYDKIFSHVEFVNRESPIVQTKGYMYTEPSYMYEPIKVPNDIVVFMQGYFQSYKYFWDCMGDIIKQFRTNLGDDFMKKEYDELRSGEKTVCVHVRRTDNITNCAHHTLLGEEYYINALEHMNTGRLLVFSDDPESIKRWDVWKTRDTVFVDETDPVRALWLMNLCDSFVIANSSFSLNAYLMAKFLRDTPCVAPAQWTGPLGVRFKIHDLLPPGTIIIA
jgi:hypothetical protein